VVRQPSSCRLKQFLGLQQRSGAAADRGARGIDDPVEPLHFLVEQQADPVMQVRAPRSRSGPAPNSVVSRRCGTVPGPSAEAVPAAPFPSMLIVSTSASDSSSKETTRATDRLVTLSARTSCIT
jgi:hypothetical protein